MQTTTLLQDAIRRHRAGSFSGAEPLYLRVLANDPDNLEAQFHLGSLYAQAGRGDAAIPYLHRALTSRSDIPEYHTSLANALAQQGRVVDAEAWYRSALDLVPEHPEALRNLGLLLQRQGRAAESVPYLESAAALLPADAELLNGLGMALRAADRLSEAVDAYHRALALVPHSAEIYNNLGNALEELHRGDDAERCLRRAVELRPGYAEAWGNVGIVLQSQERLDEALHCYARGLALNPGMNALRGNRAWILLRRGRYREGFADYEHRFATGAMRQRNFRQPCWDGRPFPGRTLLVHAEQGFGDTLQFARYLPLVKQRGGRVVLECPNPLCGLMRRGWLVDEVIETASDGAAPEPFDLQVPLPSLPYVFGTEVATIPNAAPYLRADPERVATWRARLNNTTGLKVGLVWAGNSKFSRDENRSPGPGYLANLAAVSNVCFFSLQKGDAPLALARPPSELRHTDLAEELHDFDDTAAALECMDLLISSDTSVPHLAGALGHPTWLLLPHSADWRWMEGRDDSPWYPSMRLFRQPSPGDWNSVFERVAGEITKRSHFVLTGT